MVSIDRIPATPARVRRALGGIGTDFVPYVGAIASVDLGAFDMTTTGLITAGNLDVDTLNLNANVISDSTGTISFADENLTTTGKGTFGTDELVERIEAVGLKEIVNHRKLILPQLGAVGVAAHQVKKRSGFSVIYGPIYARDIIAFLDAGSKATEQMRQVRFTFYDRLILTPVEFVMGIKYFLWFALAMLVLSGLSRQWYSPELIIKTGLRSFANLLIAFFAGAVAGPVLLPWLPGRSFSLKGMVAGLILAGLVILAGLSGGGIETAGWILVFASVGSFGTMNFTGASTFTSLSGVKREMRVAVPLQLVAIVIGVGLWIAARFV